MIELMISPDASLILWQVAIIVSWVLSVLIVIKASRAKDSRLLWFGAVSFCIPLLMTVPYFVFSKK